MSKGKGIIWSGMERYRNNLLNKVKDFSPNALLSILFYHGALLKSTEILFEELLLLQT